MSLRVVRGDPAALWKNCSDTFLTAAATAAAGGCPTHLWLTHRLQRDRLLTDAGERRILGWMPPPFSFLSELPKRFEIAGSPIGLLSRRRMISTIASSLAKQHRIPASADLGVVRGHMLDTLIGEFLPEGLSPAQLKNALASAGADDFAQRRNAWVHAVYDQYLTDLAKDAMYDTRSIHALVARAIDEGRLRKAIGGAGSLHIYGLYSLRTRNTLIQALSRQTEIDVTIYAPSDAPEFDAVGIVETLPEVDLPVVRVQPAPDPLRELQWVATEVKSILLKGTVEPHEIAIVARSGREDTRRVCERLEAAGVPYSARVRRSLHEIPVIALILEVFRGGGEGWSYRILRNVVASSYTRIKIDSRSLDVIAGRAMPRTLSDWETAFDQLHKDLTTDADRDLKKSGLRTDRVERDSATLKEMRASLEPLQAARSEEAWIKTVRAFLGADAFSIRKSLSRVPDNRYDVVRFDQRGLLRLDTLLAEWESVATDETKLTASQWYRLLRRLLESEELALSTPSQKGVQVLEAHDAAMVPFKHTFVVHVNDGEFPSRRATGGVFTEEERNTLCHAGLPLEDRNLALAREQALWGAVTSSGSVVATYRTTDPRGTPLLPSMLLPEHDVSTELPRSLDILSVPVTREQARQIAILALANDGSGTAPDAAIVKQSVISAYAEQIRGAPDRTSIDDEHRLSGWNGVMRDPFLISHIAMRYGAEHTWSASQLQTYARNPFFFLIDRVLYLRGYEEAEEETQPMTFGGVAHDILERFYTPVTESGVLPSPAEATAQIAAVATKVLAEREASGEWLGSKLMWSITRRTIANVVAGYVEWEIPYLLKNKEVPWKCEFVIGGDDNPARIEGIDRAGKKVTMKITGRIDRIDMNAKKEYLVLDYKTGKIPSQSGYADGALLQGALYTEVLRQIWKLNATTGRYRSLKKPGDPMNGAQTKVGDKHYEPALLAAFSIPGRVQAGVFECIMCNSSEYLGWDHDAGITRTRAQIAEGTRFDG